MIKILKNILAIFGGIIAISLIIASIWGETSEEVDTIQKTEEQQQTEGQLEGTLGTYTISNPFPELSTTNVNLWKSYEDRTLVISLENKTKVELIQKRIIGDESLNNGQGGYEYCKVRYQRLEGWLDCVWLK